ncbi:MAG: hypothetical protein LQ338_002492 [Usnochroma carphineum]|nr:MAG: hypothetical protein LQ338_002492 [Usnochroma carphineum]
MLTETPRSSTDSSNQEHVWLVQEDYEKPQKEMDFPPANLCNKMSHNDLRLSTYSKGDLHDRYMSSEEEPSPSPDSSDAESTHSEELKHKSSSRVLADETPIDLSVLESDAKTEIAVAMPIVAYGRPKLIDITNLAPMQKRKRAIKQPVAPSSTLNKHQTTICTAIPTKTDENTPLVANQAAGLVVPLEKAAEIARKQAAMVANRRLKERQASRTPVSSAPDSWLPEEEEHHNLTDNEREYHFPSGLSYEPYTLELIQPRQPQHSAMAGRTRNNSNPFTVVNTATAGVGKGLTRTWSIAKKGVVHHGSYSLASSSSRASLTASSQHSYERPTFSQATYQPERQVTKKPKMIARGANEREESLVLPPCPSDVAA